MSSELPTPVEEFRGFFKEAFRTLYVYQPQSYGPLIPYCVVACVSKAHFEAVCSTFKGCVLCWKLENAWVRVPV